MVACLLRTMNMSERKQYMNLSLYDPSIRTIKDSLIVESFTSPSYNTSDALLDAIDAYIEECEAQDDLRGLTQYENSLDVKVQK